MAFLAYVLRGSADNIKTYLDVFPVACVRLLRDCPPEDVATRKELLIATRHILSSEFRAAFIPHVDILLDERVLVGSGVTSREALRWVSPTYAVFRAPVPEDSHFTQQATSI
jgi:transformation/transcription domain-associated protein